MHLSKNVSLYLKAAAVFTVAAAWLAADSRTAGAAPAGQSFATPEQAAKALVAAAKTGDSAAIIRILGPSAREILTTSDPVEDRNIRQRFVARAAEKMQVVPDPHRKEWRVVEVGNDDWPLPIPLVPDWGRWRFNIAEGKAEILRRRIGDNELNALEVCRGYVEAQNEYAEKDRTGSGTPEYAQRFLSTPGKHDGLYWKSEGTDDESPIAEIVTRAAREGYAARSEGEANGSQSQPYHGYYYKILKAQGSHAPGGAMSYLEDGAMTHGFALIAWPADYGSTGVMTFVVDKTGIVYQKDLGKKTGEIAGGVTAFDPDSSWTPVRDSINP